MSYYVKVNGLNKIIFECESEQIREKFISDGIEGDMEKIDAEDVEGVLFCPLFYANACVIDTGIKCFTYGDRAKLFWMMDEQFILDGKLSETYFKNRVIEYVDLISNIIVDQDDDSANNSEEERVMAIVFEMLKYESDLEWCECIDVERSDLEDYFEMHEANFDNMLSSLMLDLHQPIAIC